MRTARVTTDITCSLDAEYFGVWEFMSDAMRAWWDAQNVLTNCEGEGIMATYCEGCPFCETFDVDTVED
jgi:hypothetical protein